MKLRGQLKSIWPDRTQYKPYAYNLEMQNVYLEVDVPDENVTVYDPTLIQQEGEIKYVLDLNGFTCLLGTIADAIDDLHIGALKAKNNRDGDSVRRNGAI
jgi:hypothetical protein